MNAGIDDRGRQPAISAAMIENLESRSGHRTRPSPRCRCWRSRSTCSLASGPVTGQRRALVRPRCACREGFGGGTSIRRVSWHRSRRCPCPAPVRLP